MITAPPQNRSCVCVCVALGGQSWTGLICDITRNLDIFVFYIISIVLYLELFCRFVFVISGLCM